MTRDVAEVMSELLSDMTEEQLADMLAVVTAPRVAQAQPAKRAVTRPPAVIRPVVISSAVEWIE